MACLPYLYLTRCAERGATKRGYSGDTAFPLVDDRL